MRSCRKPPPRQRREATAGAAKKRQPIAAQEVKQAKDLRLNAICKERRAPVRDPKVMHIFQIQD
jgi:hypothetical protein